MSSLEENLKNLKLPLLKKQKQNLINSLLTLQEQLQEGGADIKLSPEGDRIITIDKKTGKELFARPLSDFY